MEYYYFGVLGPRKQQICILDAQEAQKAGLNPNWAAAVDKPLKGGGDGVIFLSDRHVSDPDLYSSLFHELLHLGYPVDEFQTADREVDAYACEFVCAAGELYPCGKPRQGLEVCIPLEVFDPTKGWLSLFTEGKLYEQCPTPSNPTAGTECRLGIDGLPECQRCCGSDGEDNCEHDMPCWMDFAPDSPIGQAEIQMLEDAWKSVAGHSEAGPPACVKPKCEVRRVGADCIDLPEWDYSHEECEDALECTRDECTLAGCKHEPQDGMCEDEDPCTHDWCDASAGCVHSPVMCGSIGCLQGECVYPLGCVYTANDAYCNDRVGCTIDKCKPDGVCEHEIRDSMCPDRCHCEPKIGCVCRRSGGGGQPEGGGLPPGFDNPDEALSPPNLYADTRGAQGLLQAHVLQSGFYEQLASVLEKAGVSVHELGVDFLPEEALEVARVLFVPTGGLASYYGLEAFTTRIRKFAELGGVVVVLSQPKRYMYQALSKDTVAYGWWESQSCFFGGVEVSARHPVVSSAKAKTVALPVDGSFLERDGLLVLLRRSSASGSSPVMVMETVGAGRIVMTGLYPDYAYFNGQASALALDILRDLVAWGEAPDHVSIYNPNELITVEFEKEVRWRILSPDGSDVVAEGFGDVAKLVLGEGKGGVYHVLVEKDGELIPCKECRFAVMGFAFTESITPFTVTITTPAEQYVYGDNATFTVVLKSSPHEPVDLQCHWWVWQGGFIDPSEQGIETFSLEPNETTSFTRSVKVRDFGWFYVKCTDENDYSLMVRKSFLVFTPDVSLRLMFEKDTFDPNEIVRFRIWLSGRDTTYLVRTEILGAKGEVLEVRDDYVAGNSFIDHQLLAPVWSYPGHLTIHSEAYLADRIVGFATKSVKVSALTPNFELSFGPDHIVAKVKVTNPGPVAIPHATLSLSVTFEDNVRL